jgi:hypothetical protein
LNKTVAVRVAIVTARPSALLLAGRRSGLAIVAVALVAACRPPGYGRHNVDAAGDGSHVIDAPVDASAATCDQGFRLTGFTTSMTVWLTGDFVSWAADPPSGAIPFTLGVDGAWTGSYKFIVGTYQYKFIVDTTNWIADPTDPNTVPDGFGGVNSVYTCMP